MSHELRTPLNAIIGYSELLVEEAQDAGDEAMVPDLNKIHTAGKHLLGLINEVLDLSKIEAGKMEVYVEDFDVAALIEGIDGTVKPLTDKHGNTLDRRSVVTVRIVAVRVDLGSRCHIKKNKQ